MEEEYLRGIKNFICVKTGIGEIEYGEMDADFVLFKLLNFILQKRKSTSSKWIRISKDFYDDHDRINSYLKLIMDISFSYDIEEDEDCFMFRLLTGVVELEDEFQVYISDVMFDLVNYTFEDFEERNPNIAGRLPLIKMKILPSIIIEGDEFFPDMYGSFLGDI